MDEDAQPNAHRAFRAEFMFTLAGAVMCLVIGVLLLLLWRGDRLHTEEAVIVQHVREARLEWIAMWQAETDADAIVGHYLVTRQPALLSEFVLAKEEARARAVSVRGMIGDDTAIQAQMDRLNALMEERFTVLDRALASSPRVASRLFAPSNHLVFRTQSDILFSMLNGRVDAARAEQNQVRAQLTWLSWTLAILAFLASVVAITVLRRERDQWRLAHAAAEDARAKAAASDLSKTRFLAVASHDMRQPLHALMLYIGALQRRVQSEEARDILNKMDRATRSMAGMFSTLLDLARIQGGVITPEIVEFPLQEVLDRIVAENTADTLEAPSTLIAVRSDPALLERVLRNLVTNAIKHGGGKARIEIATHGREVEIAVVDEGPGIAVNDQERIFEEFVRLDGRGEGLGLGLAIVKRIGELLGAPITLRSAPGQGARFTLTAPIARAAIPTAEPAAPSAAFAGVPALVVDDDPLAREALAGALRDLGAQVRAGANEAEGEAILAQGFTPALIVMDFRIDGQLAGLDIGRRLRAKVSPSPAMIVVTGDTEQSTLATLRESGFAWLIKPVDPRNLIETAAAQLRAETLSAT